MEAVGLRAGRTDRLTIDSVSEAREVDRQACGELALRGLDAVAGAVSQQGDGFTILSGGEGSLERLVLGFADLGHILTGSEGARTVAVVHPLVVGGSGDFGQVVILAHLSLFRRIGHGSLGCSVEHYLAIERASLEHQAKAVLGIAAGGVDLHIAVDLALALHRHVDGGIAAVAAHVEGEATCRVGVDGRAIDDHRAIVVRQRVGAGVAGIVECQRHALEGQVAVVLHQDLSLLGGDGTILEGDLVVLEQLEAVGLRAGRTDRLTIDSIGEAREVDRQACGELSLRGLDAVAGAVGQQGDGFTILSGGEGSLEGLVSHISDGRHIIDGIDEHTVLSYGDIVNTSSRAIIHLDQIVEHIQSICHAHLGECALGGAVVDDNIVSQNFCSGSGLHIEGCFVSGRGFIYEFTVCSGDSIFGRTILVVDIDELTRLRIGERTAGISNVAGVCPHVVVGIRLVELAVGEIHVAIGEQFAVDGTVLHVDGASVLETMIIDISNFKGNVLKGSAIRYGGDRACCGVVEHHAIDSTFDGHVVRQVGQSVGTGLEHHYAPVLLRVGVCLCIYGSNGIGDGIEISYRFVAVHNFSHIVGLLRFRNHGCAGHVYLIELIGLGLIHPHQVGVVGSHILDVIVCSCCDVCPGRRQHQNCRFLCSIECGIVDGQVDELGIIDILLIDLDTTLSS